MCRIFKTKKTYDIFGHLLVSGRCWLCGKKDYYLLKDFNYICEDCYRISPYYIYGNWKHDEVKIYKQ